MTYYKEIDGENVFFNGNVLYTDEATIINPSHEQMLEAGWLVYIPATSEPTTEELLADEKKMKINEIDEYDQSSNVNLFYLAGQPMWLDAPTRQTLRISIESYIAMGIENVTKWFGGQQFTFPTAAWLQMLNALEVYAAEALNVTEAHKAAVMAMDNIEDVEEYDITVDYPQKLNLSAAQMHSANIN